MLAPLEPTVIDAVEAAVTMEMMVKLKIPAMYWGAAGIGKSALLRQVCERLGYTFLDYRLLLRNPVDLHGLPHILFADGKGGFTKDPNQHDHHGFTLWSRSDLIVSGKVIILFEELNAAPQSVQAAAFQLLGPERSIGGHKLGDEVAMLCCGNRLNDKGAAVSMLSPLSDRLQHFDMIVKLQPWLKNFAVPNDIHPLICGYLRLRDQYDVEDHDVKGNRRGNDNPNPFQVQAAAPATPSFRRAPPTMPTSLNITDHCGMLHRFMPQERSFPTPRSWERVSQELYEIEKMGLVDTNLEFATVAGKVGRVAATELLAFAKLFRAGFSVDRIIHDPDNAPVPADAGMRCAVASALARHATKQNIRAIFKYAERALTEEFVCMLMDDAERHNDDIPATAAFRDFSVKYADVRGGVVT